MTGTDLPAAAEIVIIGGGVIGLSVAFHLAERGLTDIVVLEKDEIGSGATRYATGGIRQQFASEADVRLSLESVRFFEQFEEHVELPFLFRQMGYLFMSSDDAQFATLSESAAMQHRLGVPVEVLTPHEIATRWPLIVADGLVGATYCPTDGSGSPTDVAYAFARRARDMGVRVLEGVEVTGIAAERAQIRAVETSHGRIAARMILNAAGPWSGTIGALSGIEIPVYPHPRQAFSVTPVEELGELFPFVIDLGSGVYIHQDPASIVLGGGDRARPTSFEATIDWSRFDYVIETAVGRVPALAEARSLNGWCGLREMTPDDHAILGPVAALDGMWCATGFSGHGFMHAPATGRILAEWMLAGIPPADFDPAPFALERFATGKTTKAGFVF